MSLTHRPVERAPVGMLLVMCALIAGIGLAGYWYHSAIRRHVETEMHHQLVAIAKTKAFDIAQWRAERLGDGKVLANVLLATLGAKAKGQSREKVIRKTVASVLATVQHSYGYSEAILFDRAGRRLAHAPEIVNSPCVLPDELLRSSIRLSDLQLQQGSADPRMAVIVPLANGQGTVHGTVVLCIDPARRLYPTIQSWPLESPTAETLLVRREGAHVLFLNDLRHVKGTALRLRRPLAHTALPAAQAVLGQTLIYGVDYRGRDVLGAAARVSDSDWFVLAKIDTEEVHAPLRARTWAIAIIVTSLMLGASAGVGFIWRTQQLAAHRQLQRAELERQAIVGHLGTVSTHANDIIALSDPSGRIIEANQRALEAYGYTIEEFKSLTARDLREPACLDDFEEQWRAAESCDGVRFETIHRRKDGTRFPVEISSRVVDIDGHAFHQTIIRDRTEQKRAEAELRRVNRALRVLSECNGLVMRAEEESRLLSDVADVVVQQGGYRMAWIGWAEFDQERSVRPVAIAGHEDGYLQGARVSWGDTPRGNGPVGTSIRSGRTVVCRDIENDPHFYPWRGEAVIRGYKSMVGLPIRVAENIEGALAIYAGESDAFDEEEVRLLNQVAADLGFGIEVLRRAVELRLSEAKLSTVFDSVADAIYIHDLEGRFLDANSIGCERLGYSREELLQLKVTDVNLPEEAHYVLNRMAVIQRTDKLLFRTTHVTKTGSTIPVEVSSRWMDYGGTPAVVSSARDLRERLRFEQELEKSAITLSRAQRAAHVGSWDVEILSVPATENQRRYEWSEQVFRILGIERPDSPANHNLLAEYIHPDDRDAVVRAVDRSLSGAGGFEIQHRIVRPSGEVRWVRTQGDVVRGDAAHPARLSATIQDITDYRRLEEQFQQSQKLESVGRLAGGVAHDFNNLLTVINGYADISLRGMDAHHPLLTNLTEIRKAGERAADLTRQLLAFSRKQIIAPKVVSINNSVVESRKMLQRLLGEDIELITTMSEEAGQVLIDRGQLYQLLMNLTVNARDAMPDGGTLIIETSKATLDETDAERHEGLTPGKFAVISVTDTGSGMTEEVRRRIFEPFFTTKPKGTGTGLGLSTVYGIVRQSGGAIWVYSEVGRGTTFKIYLPSVDEQAEVVSISSRNPESLRGTETILVVEDQVEVRVLAVSVLRAQGYEVLEVSNGAEALVLSEQFNGPIHLMLTDVVMPGMTGRQLADRLSAMRPSMKVLYMSGYTEDSIARQGVLEPGVDFLPKPFSPGELASRVRASLGMIQANGASILVVDDEDGIRVLLSRLLSEAGYRVSEAANGKEAFQRVDTGSFDVVITDLVMPEQEGIELVQQIRRSRPDTKIIAISGAFGGSFLKAVRMLGANATLAKPIKADDLLSTVQDVLRT